MALDFSGTNAYFKSLSSDRVHPRLTRESLDLMERLGGGKSESINLEASFVALVEVFRDRSSIEWELLALGYMILTDSMMSPVRKAKIPNSEIPAIILDLLENKEPRLRDMVAGSLESLSIIICKGCEDPEREERLFTDALINPILDRIEECFLREVTTRPTALGSEVNIPMDDTTGWHNLETSVKALHCLCKGCNRRVVWACVEPLGSYTAKVNDVLKGLMKHPNRYAREECLKFITTLCDALQKPPKEMDIAAIRRWGAEEGTIPATATTEERGNVVSMLSTGTVSIKRFSEHTMQEMNDVSSAVVEDDDMFSFSLPSRVGQGKDTDTIKPAPSQPGEPEEGETKREKVSSRANLQKLPVLSPSLSLCSLMSKAIQEGLQDQWSQVRLVATHAATSFLKSLLAGQEIKDKSNSVATRHSTASETVPGSATTPSSTTLYMPLASGVRREQARDWAALLREIYEKHNPSKVGEIPTILQQFKGREMFMLRRLKDKYGLSADIAPADGSAIQEMKAVDLQRQPETAAQLFHRSLRGGTDSNQSTGVPAQFLTAYPDLLPRLCMNRFYAAEGVKRAAHASWREIMGRQGGVALLSAHVTITVAYYSEMTKSNSHMIAESGLHAMKELALRVPRASVVKVLPQILETLRACVQDESWPVKDAAVGALGSVLATFAFEISEMEADSSVDEDGKISTLFFRVCCEQLLDAIPSVRETAAVALADICSLKGDASVRKAAREAVCSHLVSHLDIAAAQKREEDSKKTGKAFLPSALLAVKPTSLPGPPSPPPPPHDDKQRGGGGWRKAGGWGCCLDCMEVRQGSVRDAEEGCLTLLQELPASGGELFHASQPLLKLVASKHPQYLALFE